MQPHDTADGVVRIPVHSKSNPGLYALVDAEDAEVVSQFSWTALVRPWATYATFKRRGICIYMHRLITGATKGQVVDHANHDGLDNRRVNLRKCTNGQNMCNRSSLPRNNKTGFMGIRQKSDRFSVRLSIGSASFEIHGYPDAESAARARDALAIIFHGEYAFLNFPDERPEDRNAA